jgi:SAM-dependent methyltransferase
MSTCLLCGSSRSRALFSDGGVDILRCGACGHVFSGYPGDPHFDGFWGDDVEPGAHLYWSRARARMHDGFVRRFLRGRSGRLLDMGCGLGFFVQVVARQPGWEAAGCEISAPAVRHARDVLKQQVVRARLEDAPWPAASFDVITMWDVLDHILAPDALLTHCRALLRDDGLFFIRTPNVSIHLARASARRILRGEGAAVGFLQPRDHFHHYSPVTLRRLLERNGFSRVQFLHLRPIDSDAEQPGLGGRVARSVWFHGARALGTLSGGHLNLDNLFVAARK